MIPLTPTKRGRVWGLHLAGLNDTQICKLLHYPRQSIVNTIRRQQDHGTLYDLPRSGRPSLMDDRARRHILIDIARDPGLSFYQHAAIHGCSESAIRLVANSDGVKRYIKRRAVYIGKAQAAKRLAWARENEEQDWSRVVFTDEMSVEHGVKRRTWTSRRQGEECLLKHMAPTFRSGRFSIMVWGAVSRCHKWPLVLFPEGRVTAAVYGEEILEKHLGPIARDLRRRIWQPALVVEDNAPVHNARSAEVVRKRQKINRLTHPPSSPDLNPIENLWSWTKWKVETRIPQPTSREQLWNYVQEAWEAIPMRMVEAVIDNMETRRQAVIEARGYNTKY